MNTLSILLCLFLSCLGAVGAPHSTMMRKTNAAGTKFEEKEVLDPGAAAALTWNNTAKAYEWTLLSSLGGSVSDGSITPAKLANADFGLFSVLTGVATANNGTVPATALADGNYGFFTWDSGVAQGTLNDGLSLVEASISDVLLTGAIDMSTASYVSMPVSATPATTAVGRLAFDSNAFGTSRGALQVNDGTSVTYIPGVLASDVPSNGQVLTYNTGGTFTWETISGGGGISDGSTLATGLTFPLSGLHILDTNATHDLIITPGSDLTADRMFTITTGDVNRVLTMSGDTTLAGGSHSGTNTGDNSVNTLYSGLVTNATHTGDATGATALTLATVNANVGSFGTATAAPSFAVNAKGLITAAGSNTVTPAIGSITGLGTGIASALAAGLPLVTKITAGSYTSGTTNSRENYGGVIYVTATGTIQLPAIADGMSVTIITVGNVAVSLDVDTADKMILDGITLDDGDKTTNTSTTNDTAVATYYSADGWYVMTNGWTDAG